MSEHLKAVAAASGAVAPWAAWVSSYLPLLNELAKFVLVLVGIVSGLASAYYYIKKARGQ